MTKIVDDYQNITIDIDKDIRTACKKYGNGKNEQEINLYDIYAENTKNMMNRDRRIENLKKWAALFKTDLQAQIKSRQGLEKMRTFAKENPNLHDCFKSSTNLGSLLFQVPPATDCGKKISKMFSKTSSLHLYNHI